MNKSLLLALVFFLASCGPVVDYLGKSYAPTFQVEMFFSPNDVKQPYETMGNMHGKGGSFNAIQDKMMNEARMRGADGIIFVKSDERITGSTTNSNTNWNSQTRPVVTNKPGTTVSGSNTFGNANSNTTTNNSSIKIIDAVLIKYKK